MSKEKKPVYVDSPLFTKENYLWMLGGLVIMIIGFFLMSGGKSSPTEFNDSDVYSFTRITLAPIFILGGLIVEIFAIMKKPKES